MNLLEKSVEQAFEIDHAGRVIFHPFGPHSRGRLISDIRTFESVRTKYVGICSAMLFGWAAIAVANRLFLSFEDSLWAVAIDLSLCVLCTLFLAMSLPYADEDLSARRTAGGRSIIGLAVLAYVSLLFTLTGGFLLFMGGNQYRLMAVGSLTFFGLCLAFCLKSIVDRRRHAAALGEGDIDQGASEAPEPAVVSRRSRDSAS